MSQGADRWAKWDKLNYTISKNTCKDCTIGIDIAGFDESTISDNIITNGFDGLDLDSYRRIMIEKNDCSGNSYYGIYVNWGTNTTINGNHCSDNGRLGIALINSKNSSLTSKLVY